MLIKKCKDIWSFWKMQNRGLAFTTWGTHSTLATHSMESVCFYYTNWLLCKLCKHSTLGTSALLSILRKIWMDSGECSTPLRDSPLPPYQNTHMCMHLYTHSSRYFFKLCIGLPEKMLKPWNNSSYISRNVGLERSTACKTIYRFNKNRPKDQNQFWISVQKAPFFSNGFQRFFS